MAPLLTVEDLHASYGEAPVLHGVSLRLEPGEIVTIVGRAGAGKTTTLRAILGLVQPSRGRVTLRGADLAGQPTDELARRGLAWVPAGPRSEPDLSVLQYLRLGLPGAPGGPPAAALEEVFGYFPRLRERSDQPGRALSGGEQQMLGIARGLLSRPAVMLVDEPTAGLAPIIVRTLVESLARINQRGTALLLAERTLAVAMTLSHRLYVMDEGRIRFEGTPGALRNEPGIQQRFLEG